VDKKNSGVGVLDKAVTILGTLESGPHSLAELVAATGIARPTAHRLAVALEHHRLVTRDLQGRFVLGQRSGELAAAAGEDRLLAAAAPALAALRDATGESAQLYRRQGDIRICVAVAERLSGLRDSVPVGASLTMQAGSAAQILLAWEDSEKIHRGVKNARFTAAHLAAAKSSIIRKIDLDSPSLARSQPVQGGCLFEAASIQLNQTPGLGISAIPSLQPL
jgi:DNA-binding IclR family transcriptional regulator